MPNQIAGLLNTIDADKATLDAARPLPRHTVASLREKLMLEWTYHSNAIEGASTTPPDFLHPPAEMAALITWYETAGNMHPVERAAELHTRFVKIHPFVDGNGRTGRLLLNFELMKASYPPAIIRKEDRLAYYAALDKACVSGDYSDTARLAAESVQRSLDNYLDVLGLRRATAPDTAPPSPGSGM
ncbi:Fic family protein [Paraburkholderia sp. D15]|uniref:Fic family protein n=1 Tax=Paraburkholderia sp. D15 TaxID=2880218 RepID=UPI002478A202|nr:Fic family protein [Paraburkholderia sp. D15]WGS52031.1 Fic family protein [Paraburkholderia sp. D15]